MPELNRFYQPARGQYISQFVPDELPAQLMMQGLGRKQQQYDQMAATLTKLGDWDQRALQGYDTSYVESKKGEIEQFTEGALTRDLASPEFAREYQKFVKDFKDDEGLKAISGAVATHDQYLEREKALKEGKGTDYDEAFVENYRRHYGIYTSKGGQGFTGEVGLSDPSIFEGVDLNKEMEAYFDQLKASGSESVKFLSEGVAYKNGWTRITGERIDEQVNGIMESFYNSRGGKQLQARFEQRNIPHDMTYEQFYQELTPEQRQEFEDKKRGFVSNQLTNTGLGFTFSKSTTNADAAYTKLAGWDREDRNLNPQNPALKTHGNTMGWSGEAYDKAIETWTNNKKSLQDHEAAVDVYTKFLKDVRLDNDPSRAIQNLTGNELEMLRGIPGAEEFVSGQGLSPEKMDFFRQEVEKKVADHEFAMKGLEIEIINSDNRLNSAIQALDPKRRFGSNQLSYQNATELGIDLQQDPLVANEMSDIQTIVDTGGDYESYINKQFEKVRVEFQNGNQSAEAKEIALQKVNRLNDMKTWAEASAYASTALSNPAIKTAVIDQFNKTDSYQPIANVMPLGNSYTQYSLNKNGDPVKLGNSKRADAYIEELARTSLNTFAVYIGTERITPGDPRYPSQESIEFASSNIELVNGHPVFNGSGQYGTVIDDPKGTTIGDDGEIKKVERKQTQNYTFVAEGVDTQTYLGAKANEAYSNIVVDQGYDPSLPLQFQENLSPAGQSSLKNYISYQDPDMANKVATMEHMSGDDRTLFTRPMYNPYSGQVDNIQVNVIRDSQEGDYIIEMRAPNGQNMNPDAEQVRVNSAGQAGTFLLDYEKLMNQDGANGTTYTHPDSDPEASVGQFQGSGAISTINNVPLSDNVDDNFYNRLDDNLNNPVFDSSVEMNRSNVGESAYEKWKNSQNIMWDR